MGFPEEEIPFIHSPMNLDHIPHSASILDLYTERHEDPAILELPGNGHLKNKRLLGQGQLDRRKGQKAFQKRLRHVQRCIKLRSRKGS